MKRLGIVLALALLVVSCGKKEDPFNQENNPVCNDPRNLSILAGNTSPEAPCLIPQEERKAVIMYFMSNDCPGCGSWGTSLFHSILDAHPDKTLPFQIHIKYSDPWILPGVSDSLVKRFNPRYTPFVMVENRVTTGTVQVVSDPSVVLPKAAQWIDEVVSEKPDLAPALDWQIEGDRLRVFYGGKFLKDVTGEYHVGIYVMEDSLEYNQIGNPKRPYFHYNTIRASLGNIWGFDVEGSSHLSGDYFIGETETEAKGYWKREDLHVMAIVWKRDEKGLMQFVNAIHRR